MVKLSNNYGRRVSPWAGHGLPLRARRGREPAGQVGESAGGRMAAVWGGGEGNRGGHDRAKWGWGDAAERRRRQQQQFKRLGWAGGGGEEKAPGSRWPREVCQGRRRGPQLGQGGAGSPAGKAADRLTPVRLG